ncbi:calcium load-activated calcium channel-like [Histomonas meleagridis]|uniref:calcium load-activated calcium channel-like n=1 Tax=Histomonas meleagridis TaxID=135588 RepID=UPI00355A509E|nr:calcium load-activated calcium channel-like [Histomonas meleagridis]KAH0796788.1 calcium load-activated calcium channel-like [Histomonas meleagridis]
MLQYLFLSVGASLVASIINVTINWFLMYRDSKFVSQSEQIEKNKKIIEELQSKDEEDKASAKKIKRLNKEIEEFQKDISMKSAKSNLISGIVLFMFNRLVKGYFENIVCAKIPFTPFGIISRISHSGIENDNLKDGNFQFIYWLGTTVFRDMLNKLFGFQLVKMDFQSMMDSKMQQMQK